MSMLVSKNNLLFSEENSDRIDKAHINNLTDGQVAIFPLGYIHYEQNLGCKPAHFISALNHEDPGLIKDLHLFILNRRYFKV